MLATGTELWFDIIRMTDETKFERGPEPDPTAGEKVSAPPPLTDPVLAQRFRDMDDVSSTSTSSIGEDPSAIAARRLKEMNYPFRTAAVGSNPRRVRVDVTKPVTQAELDEAREMTARMTDSEVAKRTGLSEKVVRGLRR